MFGLVFIVFILGAVIFGSIRNKERIKLLIYSKWGKVPDESITSDKTDSVSKYWKSKIEIDSDVNYIDDLTWNDLGMDDVFKRINATFSSLGAEYLYAKIRQPEFDIERLNEYEGIIRRVEDNNDLREKLIRNIAGIGKAEYNGVNDFMFFPKSKRLERSYIYTILSLLPFLSLIVIFININYFLWVLIPILVLNIIVYYLTKSKIETQLLSVTYIVRIVSCASKLGKIKDQSMQPYFDNINRLYKKVKSIANIGDLILSKTYSDVGALADLIKAFFMWDIISYNRMINVMCKKNEDLHELWKAIGRLDSAISIASYRRSLDFYTLPDFNESKDLISDQLYHPLVKNPISNSANIVKNSLITGSNASGKSTYIKALAINILFAQTIHTCLAKSFSLKPSFVITSMAVNDNVIDGDSYFIAEIKSLKRLLKKLNTEIRCVCFVDEILKGTNTIERIAASASILKWLVKQNCLCVVASHDIELTVILEELYDNYHFRENITDNGITFDYKIHNGRTTTRNAIKLLEFLDYPQEIITDALKFAEKIV